MVIHVVKMNAGRFLMRMSKRVKVRVDHGRVTIVRMHVLKGRQAEGKQ